MLTKIFLATALLASSAFAAPPEYSAAPGYNPFPLKDGFPAPSPKQLKAIERRAGGSLPNGGLPTKLTDAGALTLQLIAANEIFEVAYFTDLIHNITNNVHGYKVSKKEKAGLIKLFDQIVAQEELHAIGANAILASAKREPLEACRYKFPVSDLAGAVNLANVFTDLVLSVLPLAQVQFATDGGQETGLVQLVGSIIAQEGEQNGFYRFFGDKVPSAAPFLTSSNPVFAYNGLKNFIVQGSCPNYENLEKNIKTLGGLNVLSVGKAPRDTVATFSVKGKITAKSHSVVYLSGQNLPVTVKINQVKYARGVSTFQAALPFDTKGFAQGLTVAAVTKGCKTYKNNALAAADAAFGPGLLEVL